MSLAARLDGIREGFLKRVPKEVVETMERATADLRGSGILDRVVKVGDVAPAFALENDRGETIRSEDLLRKGPLVLSFYRGVWWPYCNAELEALQASLPEIEREGATLVAISPQLREHSAAVREKNGLTFDILGDPGNVVARRFGLVFELPAELRALYGKFGIELPKYNGDDSWTLPMPARFVLDGSGVIRSVEADPDYTRRPEPAQTVATLRRPWSIAARSAYPVRLDD